ncbi:hypothetical protein HY524_00580 [Candidatus Berkelbacteria bacterium]|nr:hypothetical protein [Candidatus Berkelbacteria bacterium]
MKVAFYCGWGGMGHVARAWSIAQHLLPHHEVTVFSAQSWPFATSAITICALPEPTSRIRFRGEQLILQDYTPGAQDVAGYQRHLSVFLAELVRFQPDVVVVDNPAELGLITKLLGYRVVHVYETLMSTDLRWKLTWQNVDRVLIPYPQAFPEFTHYPYLKSAAVVGGFSRFDGLSLPSKEASRLSLGWTQTERVLLASVGMGKGGRQLFDALDRTYEQLTSLVDRIVCMHAIPVAEAEALAAKYPKIETVLATPDLVLQYLRAADVGLLGASYNTVMESLAASLPSILVPQPRIYGEHANKAHVLQTLGAALVLPVDPFPTDKAVVALIQHGLSEEFKEKIRQVTPSICDGNGAARAAQVIIEVAATSLPRFSLLEQSRRSYD